LVDLMAGWQGGCADGRMLGCSYCSLDGWAVSYMLR
jgi:hypothetical protein